MHTTWESNIRAYELLKGQFWTSDRQQELMSKLIEGRVGLYNNRTMYITQFTDKFIKNYKWYLKRKQEKWTEYRDRVMDDTYGLGHAKTSFAIEMIYPLSCRVVCIDTHIAKYFGKNQSKLTRKDYNELEQHYISTSYSNNKQPTIFRWSYWDAIQHQTNPRYWSYVLENEKVTHN